MILEHTPGRMVGGALMVPYQTIFENIAGAYNLQTFTALTKAAYLSDLFSDEGPLTVFAPNDKAFGRTSHKMFQVLFEEENRSKLLTLLAQYILAGNRKVDSFVEGEQQVTTLGGKMITVIREGKRLWVNNYLVETVDIASSNGVVHVLAGLISS